MKPSTPPDDSALLHAARAALDASVQGLDAQRLSRLNQARHRALARLEQRGSALGWLRAPLAARWLPGGIALASVALLTLNLVQPASTPPAPLVVAETATLEVLALHDDLELLDDLDFYEWLARQPKS